MFDKVVSLAAKGEVEDSGLLIWSSIIGISALIIIGVLFGLGFKESIDKFSWFSLIAWLIVLYMWVLCNVDNPNYQKKTDGKTTSGGKDVDYATLKDE